jgi:hypothetical protein
MKTSHKLGYGIGFVTMFLLIAYGFFPAYDQFRLGLAALGIAGMITIISAWADHGLTEDSVRDMDVQKLAKLRPDLMIAQKTGKPPQNVLPDQEEERPIPRHATAVKFDEKGNLE